MFVLFVLVLIAIALLSVRLLYKYTSVYPILFAAFVWAIITYALSHAILVSSGMSSMYSNV